MGAVSFAVAAFLLVLARPGVSSSGGGGGMGGGSSNDGKAAAIRFAGALALLHLAAALCSFVAWGTYGSHVFPLISMAGSTLTAGAGLVFTVIASLWHSACAAVAIALGCCNTCARNSLLRGNTHLQQFGVVANPLEIAQLQLQILHLQTVQLQMQQQQQQQQQQRSMPADGLWQQQQQQHQQQAFGNGISTPAWQQGQPLQQQQQQGQGSMVPHGQVWQQGPSGNPPLDTPMQAQTGHGPQFSVPPISAQLPGW